MKMDGGRQRIFIKLTLVEIDILIILPTMPRQSFTCWRMYKEKKTIHGN